MDKPELEIPNRFVYPIAARGLMHVGGAGKMAGYDVKKGHDESRGCAEISHDSLAGLVKAQMSLVAAKA